MTIDDTQADEVTEKVPNRLEIYSQKEYDALKEWHHKLQNPHYPWPFSICRRMKDGRIACLKKKWAENKVFNIKSS